MLSSLLNNPTSFNFVLVAFKRLTKLFLFNLSSKVSTSGKISLLAFLARGFLAFLGFTVTEVFFYSLKAFLCKRYLISKTHRINHTKIQNLITVFIVYLSFNLFELK